MDSGRGINVNGRHMSHLQLQRDGHIQALLEGRIMQSLIDYRYILRAVVWASDATLLIPEPVHVESAVDVFNFCNELFARHPQMRNPDNLYTIHSSILRFVRDLPIRGNRRIVDICTDQHVADGDREACMTLRDQIAARGTTINGLVIGDETLLADMRQHLTTGFCINVSSWEDYVIGIRKKLHFEIV